MVIETPPLLVLCDINGTLLIRIKGESQDFNDRAPDLVRNRSRYYFRPKARDLIKLIKNYDFVTLGFYTSMRDENAMPAAAALLDLPPDSEKLEDLVYGQTWNKRDLDGENNWSMMRDMDRLWNSGKGVANGFTKKNTLMLDDCLHKLREHPRNLVVIPEYTPAEHNTGDCALNQAINTIKEVLDEWRDFTAEPEKACTDVRVLLEFLGIKDHNTTVLKRARKLMIQEKRKRKRIERGREQKDKNKD
jgi:hypothetical protein